MTGARALSLSEFARDWARDQIRRAFDAFRPTLVQHGGCRNSPDRWAQEAAEQSCVARRVFFADGRLGTFDANAGLVSPWGSWLRHENDEAGPVLRNIRMVDDVRDAVVTGAEAYTLALTAPWSTTRGTMRTVLLAHEAGLRIELCPCPRAFAPKGLR